MDRAPNTLFDRLVERTLHSKPAIEAPWEPLFDRFEEEAVETAGDSPRAAIVENTFPVPRASVQAPAAGRELPRLTPARVEISVIAPPQIEPWMMSGDERVEAAPLPIQTGAASPGAPEARVLTVGKTRTAESAARPAERQPAVASRGEAPHQVRVGRRVTEPRPDGAPPVVEPDLPPRFPQAPAHALAIPLQAPSDPAIHVTIGRLEIRAGAKEKPAARRTRTSQGPSLEQYLTQRRGGAR